MPGAGLGPAGYPDRGNGGFGLWAEVGLGSGGGGKERGEGGVALGRIPGVFLGRCYPVWISFIFLVCDRRVFEKIRVFETFLGPWEDHACLDLWKSAETIPN